MRALIVCVLLVAVGGGCATAPEAVPSSTQEPRKRRKKRVKPVEAPLVVEGPDPEEPAEEAPPEGEEPFEEGMASYYADMLSGNKTANGERYRPDKRTCAHRKHSFGTILEIQVVATGRTSTCRVNDRGPYAKSRVLDVSKKVARELGMLDPGVLRVRVKQSHSSSDPG